MLPKLQTINLTFHLKAFKKIKFRNGLLE